MTDAPIVTITAAVLIFGGQVVTMIQNVILGKKSDDIKDLADGTLTDIRGQLSTALDKVNSLEKLVNQLADRKGETGKTGETGATGKTGLTGERGKNS